MAKIVGLIGSGHGKLGNTVMTVRRGQQIARVYQPVVSNPKSRRQELSRAKMRLAVSALRPVIPALRAGWNLMKPSYEFQEAIGIAIPVGNGIITQPVASSEPIVVYEEMAPVFAASMLAKPDVSDVDFSQAAEVSFEVSVPDSARLDVDGNIVNVGLVVAVVNPTAGDAVTSFKVLTAGSEAQTVSAKVPDVWSGMEVHVYCFLKQIPPAKNGILSDTIPWKFPAPTSAGVYVGSGMIS